MKITFTLPENVAVMLQEALSFYLDQGAYSIKDGDKMQEIIDYIEGTIQLRKQYEMTKQQIEELQKKQHSLEIEYEETLAKFKQVR